MFSILIPAFKAKYLKKAIDSILNQDYRDFELIIVNDKSPENLAKIVYQYNDPRISYFENQENLGKENVVRSWNKCFEYATREFCLLFSDDDVLHPEFLSEIKKLIDKYPKTDLFYCRTAIIDKNDEVIRYSASSPEFETLPDFIWHRVHNLRDIFAQNFVFRRSALKSINGFVEFPLAWATDDATWFSLSRSNGVAATSKVLCSWRWSELNISNIGNSIMRFRAIEEYYNWLSGLVESMNCPTSFEENLRRQIMEKIPVKRKEAFEYIIERNLSNKGALHTMNLYLKTRSAYNISMKSLVKMNMKKMIKK